MADPLRSEGSAALALEPEPDAPRGIPEKARDNPENSASVARAEPTRITPRSARARLEPERVPPPRRWSGRVRHPIVIAGNALFTAIIIVAVAAGLALAFGKQRFEASGPLESERIVNIPPRTGVRETADILQREGVIDSPWVFIAGVFVLKAELKAGEYQFPAKASLHQVVDTMVEGKVVRHWITLPEGLTSEQIVARILENPVLTGTIKEIPKEGTLLPETYDFRRGDQREQVLTRMQAAHRRVVDEVYERRAPDLPIKSREELVTLASIIEKETGRPEERSRVAAVFVNRLKLKMRLQSDPTIIYGLVGGKGTLGRAITRSDIDQATPYNTYVKEGLPPGPIANPGRASIEAAANPARTKELYFVADGTGGHVFAETLDQHNRNVARWRQIEHQQRDGARNAQDVQAPAYAPTAPADAHAPAVPSSVNPPARPPRSPSGNARTQRQQ